MTSISAESDIDPDLRCESPILAGLLEVWENARVGKALPRRADIDPLRIAPQLLPHVLLVDIERGDQTRFRWRLIGTHITSTFKRDMTGRYWDEIYNGPAQTSLRLRTDWIFEHRSPIRSYGRIGVVENGIGTNEALFMPLSDDGEEIDMIMMGSVYSISLDGC